ncbi:MAG TPA: glycosyltransferase [Flavilitoribacter sp.]|nr:glycosyltransferase [Flavilitoribacter sp.]HMQ90051.1 glycosyltransferase [Flavilitoribacter sp.]
MKVLLLVPKRYGFHQSFRETFESLGGEIHTIDYSHLVRGWQSKVNTQMFRFPDKLRLRWESYFYNRVNQFYLQEYNRIKPDIVFIYNNELLLPETLAHFKRHSKIGFFLGDCPYYTPTSRHFLPILYYADAIYTYDTFWIEQLTKVGLKNMHYLYPHTPAGDFYEKELPEATYQELKSEVLYVGMCYKTSWGFKKAKFLSCFTDFDLQIHGDDSWPKWFSYFPELEKRYYPRSGHITVERLNDMYNATKIAPVDANPGLLNALHWRWVEALGAGALPVMEWQQNVAEIFGDADVPAIKCFDEAREVTAFYLNNEDKRQEMVRYMQKIVAERHSVEGNAAFIAETMGMRTKVKAH